MDISDLPNKMLELMATFELIRTYKDVIIGNQKGKNLAK